MAGLLWLAVMLGCVAGAAMGQEATAYLVAGQTGSGQCGGQSGAPITLTPRSHAEREARYRANHHIILNVLAVDGTNAPVTGLRAEDFVLLDNGKPQGLASFREVQGDRSVYPAHVLLVVDAVNNTKRGVGIATKEIGAYLEMNEGRLKYPTSIAVFTTAGFRAGEASTDGAALLRESRALFEDIHPYECKSTSEDAARSAEVTGHGEKGIGFSVEKTDDGHCLNERFTRSFTALDELATAQKDVPGRVIVIWIGPGWPLLNGPEFHADSAEIKGNFFDHFVRMARILREGQVTVDAVSSPEMFRKAELQGVGLKSLAEGPANEQVIAASDLGLQAIATESGGRVFESSGIADEIARCVADVQTYYALSFDATPSASPDEYHTVEVKVNRAGVKALTNTLYYGEP